MVDHPQCTFDLDSFTFYHVEPIAVKQGGSLHSIGCVIRADNG